MDEVVCAHNFFLSERGEADFASNYTFDSGNHLALNTRDYSLSGRPYLLGP
jgi:hypothetical protein